MINAWIAVAVAAVLQTQEGSQDPDPRDLHSDPSFSGRPAPSPAFPEGDGFTLRAHFLRSRFALETSEFDIASFSGPLDLHDVGGLSRHAVGLEGVLDSGPLRFIVFGLHQHSRGVLDRDTTFEQHRFPAGAEAKTVAFFGSAEAYGRFDLQGGADGPFRLSLLIGIDASKFLISMSADERTASEGFSALWPVPAAGLEGRVQLGKQVAIRAGMRGSQVRFVNPYQLDAGSKQDVSYAVTRVESGVVWDATAGISLSIGYTSLRARVEISSPEDTDTGRLEASGIHASLAFRF